MYSTLNKNPFLIICLSKKRKTDIIKPKVFTDVLSFHVNGIMKRHALYSKTVYSIKNNSEYITKKIKM